MPKNFSFNARNEYKLFVSEAESEQREIVVVNNDEAAG